MKLGHSVRRSWLSLTIVALTFSATLMSREAGRLPTGAEWIAVLVMALVLGAWLVFCRWTWRVLFGSRSDSPASRKWTAAGAMLGLTAFAGLRIVQLALRGEGAFAMVVDSALWFLVGFPLALWIAHRTNPPHVPPAVSDGRVIVEERYR